ncbi:MAG: L-2-amino-thiazoline-4-carboxylic acid hydrolase [Treponema sp.]|nr:L-2-amino-thiazoline-4-carboxylic acid hydrolase [Treponema sp.]
MDDKALAKVRSAVADRAQWLALVMDAFGEALPAAEIERLARKAIYAYGRYKAAKDPTPFSARDLVKKYVESGTARIFESEIEWDERGAENRVHRCALVDGWKAMGLPPERIDTLCDIAMEGDRGRADFHGIEMSLGETIGKGDAFCRIGLRAR